VQTNEKLLTSAETLAYLSEVWGVKRSAVTLSRWASEKIGPPYQRFDSRYRLYDPNDLDTWVRTRLSAGQRSIKQKIEPQPAAGRTA
jgi:hypothetical protein